MGMRGPGARTSNPPVWADGRRTMRRCRRFEKPSGRVFSLMRVWGLAETVAGRARLRRPPRLSLSEAAAGRGARGNLSPCAPPASPSESNQYFALSARARDAGDAPRSGKFSKTPERPGRLARATTGAKYPSRWPLRWKAAGRNAPCFSRRAPRITNSCMSPAPEANTGTLPFRPHRRTRNRRNSQNAKTQPFGGSPPPDGGARIDL